MKRIFSLLSAVIFSGVLAASAANLPLYTGPAGTNPTADWPIGLGTINQLVQAVNTGVSGAVNAQTGAVATGAGTSEQILQQYTLPANSLSAAGQQVTIRCWGTTAANTNNKTRKLYFGASVITTATEAANAAGWDLSLTVMRTGAATQAVVGRGQAGTAGATNIAVYQNAGTDSLAASVLIKCTGTDATDSAGDITANAMTVSGVK